jgi:trk system potassium uptake protein TrkH
VDYSDSSSLLTMILMFIGGSPGSTAGGIKTTTFLVLYSWSCLFCKKKNNSINIFRKRLDDNVLRQASSVFYNLYKRRNDFFTYYRSNRTFFTPTNPI